MNLKQFFLIVRARWLTVLGVVVAVVAAALVVSLLLPKTYAASTAVVFDVKSADPIAGPSTPSGFLPGYMATQEDIITSERVAQRVIKILKLDEVPATRERWRDQTQGRGSLEQWLAPSLQRNLEVKPSRDSNVINIGFSGADPRFVSAVANAFAQAYIDTSLELRVEPAKQYAEWFDARTNQLRAKLEQAQQALSAYQRKRGIVATEEGLDYETTRLNEISGQLTQIQALRSDTASRQRQAGAGNENVPEVLQSPLIASLKADLARAEMKWQDVKVRLGKNHPEYIKTQSDITSLRERITLETRRVASSLGSANRVNVQRETELRGALDAQKKKVLRLKEQRDGLSVLQRDVEGAQRDYDLVTQRLTQASLESQSQQTNIAVLTPAEPPLDASGPKVLRNVLVAIVVGTMLGVGAALLLELRRRRVLSAEDLAQATGVPVLAVIDSAAA